MLIAYSRAILAVVGFSLTLPMSKIAVTSLPIGWVGPGRAWPILIISIIVLASLRIPFPKRRHWIRLIVIGIGAIIAFPWVTAYAVSQQSTQNTALVVAFIPIVTAWIAAVFY